MNCKELQQEIVLYYSDELSSDRKSLVEGHLKVCSSCTEFAAGISNMTGNIHKLPRETKEIDVWPDVRKRIERKAFSVPRYIIVPAMAAVFLGIIVTNTLIRQPAIINTGDIEIVKEIEFLEDYELWENLEVLEEFVS